LPAHPRPILNGECGADSGHSTYGEDAPEVAIRLATGNFDGLKTWHTAFLCHVGRLRFEFALYSQILITRCDINFGWRDETEALHCQ
jgi:hypothetical protein